MSTTSQLQWGYIGEGHCARCSALSELWVASDQHFDMDTPQCIYCQLATIKSNCEVYRDIAENLVEELNQLIKVNPISHQDIYGEEKEWCVSCGNLFSEASEPIEALDSAGDTHKVHDSCATGCFNCDETYAMNHLRMRTAQTRRLGIGGIVNFVHIFEDCDGDAICSPCVDTLDYSTCDHCERVSDSSGFGQFNSGYYCESCYDDNVYSCSDCDESYWGDDGHDCDNGIIHDWDYKPSPEFFGHTGATYHLGLELEVENTQGSHGTLDVAYDVQELLGDHAYLKRDGSISDGFEIVTHPHTLQDMKDNFNWRTLEMLRERGFRSWNASSSSCGIHVHVSRTAFGQNSLRRVSDHKRDAHMLRFMKLIYDNQRQVERLAGRSSSRWANFSDKGSLVSKVKHGRQENGRYSAVNTENFATLEVRVFKGSLKKERVLSAMEFVTAAVEYTRDLKVNSTNKALTWSKFVAYIVANEETYPNLLTKINDNLTNETINN